MINETNDVFIVSFGKFQTAFPWGVELFNRDPPGEKSPDKKDG
jgi:hypothetical protein